MKGVEDVKSDTAGGGAPARPSSALEEAPPIVAPGREIKTETEPFRGEITRQAEGVFRIAFVRPAVRVKECRAIEQALKLATGLALDFVVRTADESLPKNVDAVIALGTPAKGPAVVIAFGGEIDVAVAPRYIYKYRLLYSIQTIFVYTIGHEFQRPGLH
jgi:hypothetical protein